MAKTSPLTGHLLARISSDYMLSPRRLGPDAIAALRAYPWPGNARELSNVLERAALLSEAMVIPAAGPFHLHDLDNLARAADIYDMSMQLKVDQEPRGFLASRAIGSGFHSILFADCRSAADVEECVCIVRPETPEDGGTYGVATRRFTYMGYGGTKEYVQALRDIVVAIMIEKPGTVDTLEKVLSVRGVDMVQWGGSDYSMGIGRAGKPVQVIDVRPRAAVTRGQDIAEGVQWRDPEQFPQWVGELNKSEPVVVYCSYDFHVGCKTAIKLRDAGFDAKYMNSGHSGLKAIGSKLKMQNT